MRAVGPHRKRELALRRPGVFREGAPADAEHLVARGEPGDLLVDGFHDTGDVGPQHRALGPSESEACEAEGVGQAGHDVPDASVDARGVHADEGLVVADLGPVDVAELEQVCRAVRAVDDRIHGALLDWGPPPVRQGRTGGSGR